MRAFYAGTLPAKASGLLDEAMSVYADTARAETLLKQAQSEAPDALPAGRGPRRPLPAPAWRASAYPVSRGRV